MMDSLTAVLTDPQSNPAPASDSAGSPTILIVDDSPVDRRLAGSIVEKQLGLPVTYCRNGLAALAALEKALPGAIVSDLLMPELDGLELVEAVRRRYPLIPVVLMTAHGSEDVAIQALRAGAASYVPKKNLPRSLASTLEQVLAAARTDRRRQYLLGCATAVELQFTLESDPALVPPLIGHFQQYLELLHPCDQAARIQLGIALEEAILNGMYHGNLELNPALSQADELTYYEQAAARRQEPRYRERRLRVTFKVTRSRVELSVKDEGGGFDHARWRADRNSVPLGQAAGRGLVLIHSFMDQVNHNAAGNEITMIKQCAANSEELP